MRRCWPAVYFLAVACGQQTVAPTSQEGEVPAWKTSYTPAECQALVEKAALWKRCFGASPDVSVEELKDEDYVGKINCMPYSPPERLRGLWVVDLESSRFFPDASDYEDIEGRPERIWLDVKPAPSSEITEAGQGAGRRAYAVELIGRRSLCEWGYGHMGMSPHEVVAETIVSLKPLPAKSR